MVLTGVRYQLKSGGPNLKVIITFTYTGEGKCEGEEITSKDYLIDNLAKVRFQWGVKMCEGIPEITCKFSLSKNNTGNIKTNITSDQLKYSATGIHTPKNWSDWELIGMKKPTGVIKPWVYIVDVLLSVYEVKNDIFFSPKLYTDSEFTDFSLCTTEGSVPVHKTCLAAHSDVFKTMLKGEWKETAEGQVNIQGVTLVTLQQLKTYLYLGTVPDGDVDELCSLLLLARRYLIEDLEIHCLRKIAETVSSEDLFSIIEFACENQIPELPFALLQVTKDSVVSEAYRLKNKNSILEKEVKNKNMQE